MAVLNVNPTRMELTNLKRKLVTARRGHKLLKDKRDELMRQFLELIKENRELRLKVESAIKKANQHMSLACSVMSEESLSVSLMMPSQNIKIELNDKNIMSVNVPEYKTVMKSAQKGSVYSYGFAFTSGDLDAAVNSFADIMPDLIRLAQIEKTCQLLAAEIEKTRRRTNALEHVMIPDYIDTIKYISGKLEENERSNTARLMKIKNIMLQNAHNYN